MRLKMLASKSIESLVQSPPQGLATSLKETAANIMRAVMFVGLN